MPDISHDNEYRPWLYEKEWENGQIHSSARGMFYFSLFFALFWNLIAFPVSYLAMTEHYPGWYIDRLDPVLFVLLFPLVGFFLLIWVFKSFRQWSVFGRLSMTLDPYPGSIGGEVGGFLEIPVQWQSGYDFEISLNCIHHRITRSGKNSSHHQDVVWKSFAAVDYEPSAKGIRIKFKCPVDEGLNESEEAEGRSYYRWVVHIKGKFNERLKMTLDREFDIPVFQLDEPKSSQLHIIASAPEVSIEQIDEQQVIINDNTRSLELEYPRSRNKSMGWGLFFFSLIFLAVTAFLFYEAWSEMGDGFSFFSAGMTGFMGFVFGLVSFLMLGASLHMLTNYIKVRIDSSGIYARSHSLFHRSEHHASLQQIQSIDKKSTMSSGQGVNSTRYFTISAHVNGQKNITLGNGIKGQLVADSLVDLINKSIKNLSGSGRNVTTGHDTATPFGDKETRKKAFGYVKKFVLISNLIGFIIMIVFVYQFFN